MQDSVNIFVLNAAIRVIPWFVLRGIQLLRLFVRSSQKRKRLRLRRGLGLVGNKEKRKATQQGGFLMVMKNPL